MIESLWPFSQFPFVKGIYYIIYRVNLFVFLGLHILMLCNKYTEKVGDPTCGISKYGIRAVSIIKNNSMSK